MRESSRHIDGADVALAIHVGICCAVTVCLALGLYGLMQPTRTSNPGMAAYKPPPGTVIDFASPAPFASAPDILPASTEPPLEAMAASPLQQQSEANKPDTQLKTKRSKRPRAARRKQWREPMMGYAFQPYFGGYRSWY
jgi:hypothetical protein